MNRERKRVIERERDFLSFSYTLSLSLSLPLSLYVFFIHLPPSPHSVSFFRPLYRLLFLFLSHHLLFTLLHPLYATPRPPHLPYFPFLSHPLSHNFHISPPHQYLTNILSTLSKARVWLYPQSLLFWFHMEYMYITYKNKFHIFIVRKLFAPICQLFLLLRRTFPSNF